MELQVDFDPGIVTRNLDRIVRQVDRLREDIPVEFDAWQTEDMNRKRAISRTLRVERATSNFTRASTTVLPTSRWRVKKRRRLVRRRRKQGIEAPTGTNRPVLRGALVERFRQRYSELISRIFG
jgi:hypothetical protein